MWYFAWILGVLLACAFGMINVMWMETEEMLGSEKDSLFRPIFLNRSLSNNSRSLNSGKISPAYPVK